MPQVGIATPPRDSPVESGSGMKPSMFTTQMKSMSEATYGNQRPIALCRQALLGDLLLGDLVDRLADRLPRVRAHAEPAAHQ